MRDTSKLQLLGPCVLALSIAAAEASAVALSYFPTSEWLWYINLEVFKIFYRSHSELWDAIAIPAPQLIAVVLPTLGLGLAGVFFRKRLLVSLSSNLSFVYACFIAICWFDGSQIRPLASLTLTGIAVEPNTLTFCLLGIASAASFVLSHVMHIRRCIGSAAPPAAN